MLLQAGVSREAKKDHVLRSLSTLILKLTRRSKQHNQTPFNGH